jgi:glutamate---cysteine ligase / carboxylate-amine ligase
MTRPRAAPPANPAAAELRAAFDQPAPLTVGIEEELMLLDPVTLDLAPRAREVLELVEGDGRYKLELPAAQLEIMSPPLQNAVAADAFLLEARRDLVEATSGTVKLAAAGVHPFAAAEGMLNEGERYDRTAEQYGRIAKRQLVFGLQVHVAVRGADRALAVYNGLRNHLPEIMALAANAPFYAGEDSGLATVRPKLAELLPRQGVPPAIGSWEEFAAELEWGERAGAVAEPRTWWWELRPHPAYGTLELRVPDAQTTTADAAAIVAVAHSLAAYLADLHDAGEPIASAPSWRIEENRWSALSRGPRGEFADLATGELRGGADCLHALIDELEPVARRLGEGAQLARARGLIETSGADRQRAAGGPREAAEWLVASYLDN